MYQPRVSATCAFVPIRNLSYHVRTWGEPGAGKTPMVLLHGWMDVSASWQFMVDAFSQGHYIVAPDWRGFGLTRGPGADSYWFPDYLADLDFLLDHFAPGTPVDLVGHSMGGNVTMLYAGARPERLRSVVNLEGFGLAATRPAQAPARHAQWMDQLKALHRGELKPKSYASVDGVAERLMKTNPRLTRDKAQWLARHWARPGEDGRWQILGDTAHKIVNPQLSRLEEVLAAYGRITAPVLSVEASDDSLGRWWKGQYTLAEFHQRLQAVPALEKGRIEDAGHMLHHDQPEQLARMVENFLAKIG
jgi:pimeloyl-ACP methyl ester carboxylesterase